MLNIIKRNGESEGFDKSKIIDAICKAMLETDDGIDEELAHQIASNINNEEGLTVEMVQDLVEDGLMKSERKDVARRYILYRNKRDELRNKPWVMSDLQRDIWKNKYQYDGETFDEWLDRVSNGDYELKKLMRQKKFLFAGRILANRGLHKKGRKVTYSNCYVLSPPEDSIEGIFDTAKHLARTFSYSGGCGIDIGKLRPNGAEVNNASKSTTGAVSFMDLYSQITGLIGQNGRRKI